jgi:hypothetical protein
MDESMSLESIEDQLKILEGYSIQYKGNKEM